MRRKRLQVVLMAVCRFGVMAGALAASCSGVLAQASGASAETDITTIEQHGVKFLRDQQPALAATEFRKILLLEPHNPDAHSNLGIAYYMEGSFEEAAAEFQITLRDKPDLWNIAALCGLSEARTGRKREALAHLDAAFAHVTEPSLQITVGQQLFSLRFESGDYRGAAETVEKLKHLDPKNADVLYAAHQAYSQLENRSFLEMANLDPQSARMYQVRGDRKVQRGNLEGAIAMYRIAIAKDAHLSGVHSALAEMLSASTNAVERAQAQSEYEKALADNPMDEKAECGLGDIASKQNDLKMATQHYRRALELEPDDPDANEAFGAVLLAFDSAVLARTYLKRAIDLDPTNVTAYYHLSQASRKVGEVDAAKAELAEFLKLRAARESLRQGFDNLPIQTNQLEQEGGSNPASPKQDPH